MCNHNGISIVSHCRLFQTCRRHHSADTKIDRNCRYSSATSTLFHALNALLIKTVDVRDVSDVLVFDIGATRCY